MNDSINEWHKIYLGIGGNLGDRRATLEEGVVRLKAGGCIRTQAISNLYQTDPVGYIDQPAFLNLVVEAETTFSPQELLSYVKNIEIEMGRQPTFRNGPRPIDIDILFYDEICIDEAGLTIPHPRLHERGFVLAPLSEVAPLLVHPLKGRTVEELVENNIDQSGKLSGVELYRVEPSIKLPLPRLLFITGKLAALWLEEFISEVGKRLGFEPVVKAMELEVAAFITARYIVSNVKMLGMEQSDWEKYDAVILPGFTGGDIKQVETILKIRTLLGPNDLLEIEPFLEGLLGKIRSNEVDENEVKYHTEAELRQMQVRLTDTNIRIYTDGQMIYAFNQIIFAAALPEEREMRRMFRQLSITDPSHSYYLGKEFSKAALAIKLGLRYRQDRDLETNKVEPAD